MLKRRILDAIRHDKKNMRKTPSKTSIAAAAAAMARAKAAAQACLGAMNQGASAEMVEAELDAAKLERVSADAHLQEFGDPLDSTVSYITKHPLKLEKQILSEERRKVPAAFSKWAKPRARAIMRAKAALADAKVAEEPLKDARANHKREVAARQAALGGVDPTSVTALGTLNDNSYEKYRRAMDAANKERMIINNSSEEVHAALLAADAELAVAQAYMPKKGLFSGGTRRIHVRNTGTRRKHTTRKHVSANKTHKTYKKRNHSK